MSHVTASRGTPIWDFQEKEIWAFWNDERRFEAPRFAFMTRRGLLGDEIGSDRTIEVIYMRNHWIAHSDCIQSDFHGSPFFVMNPLIGPQATANAIELLLNDQEFARYFESDLGGLRAYQCFAKKLAETPWF